MADESVHFFCTRNNKWLLCLGVSIAAFALTYWPQGLLLFRYERALVSSGQLWRLASAHFVHLNTAHLLLNLTGLLLICELLWDRLPLRHGIGLLATSVAGISGLLWWQHPEMAWYAGLSGALHGLWAGCALATCLPPIDRVARSGRRAAKMPETGAADWPLSRWAGVGGLLLLGAKLILEALHGASPELAKTIGAPVATVAHLYGALIGWIYVLAWRGGRLLLRKFTRHGVFD
jgi:rhomboid family GlyGly-CTERM serine protease